MHELLTGQPLQRLQAIYEALPDDVRRALDAPIASALHSRPASLVKRPLALKVKGLRAFLVKQRDDALAADILRSYFLGPRKELVTAFLEATGVAHEDGQIEDDAAQPEPEKIAAAVDGLLEQHAAEDVTLYLAVAVQQWPDVPALEEARERLSQAN